MTRLIINQKKSGSPTKISIGGDTCHISKVSIKIADAFNSHYFNVGSFASINSSQSQNQTSPLVPVRM